MECYNFTDSLIISLNVPRNKPFCGKVGWTDIELMK